MNLNNYLNYLLKLANFFFEVFQSYFYPRHNMKTNLSIDILSATINSVAENFVLIAPDHKVLICNTTMVKTLEMFFGKKIQIGDDYRDFVVEPLKEIYFSAFENAIQGESTSVQKETSSGEIHLWFEYKANPVYDDAQNLIGVAIYAKNIDEQKKAELAIEYLKLPTSRLSIIFPTVFVCWIKILN